MNDERQNNKHFSMLRQHNYFHIHIVTLKNQTGCTFELQRFFIKIKNHPTWFLPVIANFNFWPVQVPIPGLVIDTYYPEC
jgi:hypothetical protein